MSPTSWRLADHHHQLAVAAEGRTLLYTQWKYNGPDAADRAATQLAAAAPELLEALQRLTALHAQNPCFAIVALSGSRTGGQMGEYLEVLEMAEKAINKATLTFHHETVLP